MSYCSAGGCCKKYGDSSDFRHFVRFHKFPAKKSLVKAWIDRIDRRPQDINPSKMVVCSDHFEDDDYNPSQYLKSRLLPVYKLKGLQILLKPDAIPNTDRLTGMRRIRDAAGESSRKRRKKIMPSTIDDLIEENNSILQASNIIAPKIKDYTVENGLAIEGKISATDSPASDQTTANIKHKSVYTQTIESSFSSRSNMDFSIMSDSEDENDELTEDDPHYFPVESVLCEKRGDVISTKRYSQKNGVSTVKPISTVITQFPYLQKDKPNPVTTAYQSTTQNIAVLPIQNHNNKIKTPDLTQVLRDTQWIVHCCGKMFDLNVGTPINFETIANDLEVPTMKTNRMQTLKHLANIIGLQTKKINNQEIVVGFPMFKNTPDFTEQFAKQIAEVTIHQMCPDSTRTDQETRALVTALADVIMQAKDIHKDTPPMTLAKVVMVQPGTGQNIIPSHSGTTSSSRKRRKIQSTSSSGCSPKATSTAWSPKQSANLLNTSGNQKRHTLDLDPVKAQMSPVLDHLTNTSDQTTHLNYQQSSTISEKDLIDKSILEQLIFDISDKTLGLVETENDITFNKVANLTFKTTEDFWKNDRNLLKCRKTSDDKQDTSPIHRDGISSNLRVTEFFGRLDTAEDLSEREDLSALSGDDINYKDHMNQIFAHIEEDTAFVEKIDRLYKDKLNPQIEQLLTECEGLDLIARRQLLMFYSTLTHEILSTAGLLGVVSFITTIPLDQDAKEVILNESVDAMNSSDRMFLCGLIACLVQPHNVNITLPYQDNAVSVDGSVSDTKGSIHLGYLELFNKLAAKDNKNTSRKSKL